MPPISRLVALGAIMKRFASGAKFARLFWLTGLLGLASTANAHHEPVPYSTDNYNETFFRAHALFVKYNSFGPNRSAVIDVNGDGHVDLVFHYANDEQTPNRLMKVFLNDGHGNFRDGTKEIFPAGVPSLIQGDFIVADFNADGRPDLFFGEGGKDAPRFRADNQDCSFRPALTALSMPAQTFRQ